MRFLGYFALALAVAAVLWSGWPTPYVTYQVGGVVKRVNRWTGVEEVSSPGGWRKMTDPFAVNVAQPNPAAKDPTATRGKSAGRR